MPKTNAKQKTPGRRGVLSPIEAHLRLLGKVPDSKIARLSGASREAVAHYRARRKIPAFDSSKPSDELPLEKGEPVVATTARKGGAKKTSAPKRTKAKPGAQVVVPTNKKPSRRTSKLDAFRDVLGVLDDAEVGRRAGLSAAAVRTYRSRHGIVSTRAAPTAKAKPRTKAKPVAATAKATPLKTPATPRTSKLDAYIHMFGVYPDAEIARRARVSRERVRQVRLQLGVPRWSLGVPVPIGLEPTAHVPAPKSRPTAVPALHVAPAPTADTNTNFWRVSLSDGTVTHLVAGSVEDAVRKAHAALGQLATGVVWLGALL